MSAESARNPERITTWSDLGDREPTHARAAGVDLVVIRYDDEVSVLYGRCLHRGVLLGDGHVEGEDLICGVHGWDYRYDTGVSEYDNSERLEKFPAWVEADGDGEEAVFVDAAAGSRSDSSSPRSTSKTTSTLRWRRGRTT